MVIYGWNLCSEFHWIKSFGRNPLNFFLDVVLQTNIEIFKRIYFVVIQKKVCKIHTFRAVWRKCVSPKNVTENILVAENTPVPQ